jgi:hypothetical protein
VVTHQRRTPAALQAEEAVARSQGARLLVSIEARFDLPNCGQATTQIFRALEADAAGGGGDAGVAAVLTRDVRINKVHGQVQHAVDVDVAGGRKSGGSGNGAGDGQGDQRFFHCFLLKKNE